MTTDKVKVLVGNVVSRSDKTIVVSVSRRVKHTFYKKYLTRSTKIHAHDENNDCGAGDKVSIRQSRPISKTKSWVLEEILEKSA